MTATQWVIVLQIAFGSGILLYLIRLFFLIGKYVEQVETLRTSVKELKVEMHDLKGELKEIGTLRVLVAKLEVSVESFRVDLSTFRERRTAERRAH